jgi:hypothetical protein
MKRAIPNLPVLIFHVFSTDLSVQKVLEKVWLQQFDLDRLGTATAFPR